MNVLDAAIFDEDLPPDDGLALLKNDAMRARRRPWAIAWTWAWEAAVALLIASPASALVRAAYGHHPEGDAPLWHPGALELADLLTQTASMRSALIVETVLVLVMGALVGLLPLGALLASIAFVRRDLRAPSLRAVLGRALFAFRPMLALMAGAVSAQIVVVLVGLFVGEAMSQGLAPRMGEARSDQLSVLVAGAIMVVAVVIGVVHDLARAAVIRYRVGAIRGAQLGWNTLRRTPASLVWSWSWRGVAALLPVAMGALVADGLGGHGGAALVALFAVHQAVIAARVAFRASWLAKALRAVDNAHRVIRIEHA